MGKSIKRFAICVIVVACCLFGFWYAVAPLASRLFISEDCIHHGLEFFREDAYLSYEDADHFKTLLSKFCVTSDNDIIDFYHVDNYIEDNPIHGKMCDVFALDVAYSTEQFDCIKETVLQQKQGQAGAGDFVTYSLPYDPTLGKFIYIVGFCDQEKVVRYIMITEFDDPEIYFGVFTMHTNLNWNANELPKGQGGGLREPRGQGGQGDGLREPF